MNGNLSSYGKNVLSLSVSYILQSKQSNHEINNPDEREKQKVINFRRASFKGFINLNRKKNQAMKLQNTDFFAKMIFCNSFPLNCFSYTRNIWTDVWLWAILGLASLFSISQSANLVSRITSTLQVTAHSPSCRACGRSWHRRESLTKGRKAWVRSPDIIHYFQMCSWSLTTTSS